MEDHAICDQRSLRPITSLGAGQTTDVFLPYTFTKAGNFESIAIVDTKNTVPETNEKNNTQILPVTVLAAGIDLSVSSISTQPDPPVADGYPNDPVQGRNETTTIVVHNGGNTAAGPFQVKWVPKPFAPAVTKAVASLGAELQRVDQPVLHVPESRHVQEHRDG